MCNIIQVPRVFCFFLNTLQVLNTNFKVRKHSLVIYNVYGYLHWSGYFHFLLDQNKSAANLSTNSFLETMGAFSIQVPKKLYIHKKKILKKYISQVNLFIVNI